MSQCVIIVANRMPCFVATAPNMCCDPGYAHVCSEKQAGDNVASSPGSQIGQNRQRGGAKRKRRSLLFCGLYISLRSHRCCYCSDVMYERVRSGVLTCWPSTMCAGPGCTTSLQLSSYLVKPWCEFDEERTTQFSEGCSSVFFYDQGQS